ncbi:hypothetical protein IAG25_31265 [Caballeronia sp. EK]|uniref:hypothetical protein n=1 Tax=Caballeronia sp. EK TaxID=2767469 RepID=UPI0016562F62|nr:hypothetical protein [Caballeronia sp. EK]MBC8641302.1 hypothetical protein [Caballeronia sp. EK]
MPTFHKSDIARAQLETAVDIFLKGLSYHSVITLAGAASGILDGLVLAANKEPFIDYARRVHAELQGQMPGRIKFAHYIEKMFGISSHKHMHKTGTDAVELDLKRQGANALTKAIGDYIALNGQEEPFVKAFLQRSWVTMDGQGLMKKYAELPTRMKPKTES